MTAATFRNQVILITGASRGLGRALAINLARQGAKVALNARGSEELEKVAQEIRADGGTAGVYPGDISDQKNIFPLLGRVQAEFGAIDVLINNASTLGPTPLRTLLDTECEDFEAVLQRNLLAPFRLSKGVLGNSLVRNSGTIVNISSDAAVEAYPTWGIYSAAKSALDHLTKIWAAELVDSEIKIFSYDPTEMDTQMHAKAIPEAERSTLAQPEEIAEDLSQLLLIRDELESGSRFIAKKWKSQ